MHVIIAVSFRYVQYLLIYVGVLHKFMSFLICDWVVQYYKDIAHADDHNQYHIADSRFV